MRSILLGVCVILLSGSPMARSQRRSTPAERQRQSPSELRSRYGLFLDYNFNTQRADFRALPGVPNCCPLFNSGKGQGVTFGALVEIPVARSLLLDFRPVYSINSTSLTAQEPMTVSVGGVATPGIFEHAIDARIDRAGLESLLDLRLSRPFSILIGGGVYAVVRKSFDQKETIVEPAETGTFENGLRVRNETGGDIPNANSLHADLLFGASYEFPLDRNATTFGALEMFYTVGLTPIVKDLSWNMNVLRLGVALKWSAAKPPPAPESAAIDESATPIAPRMAPESGSIPAPPFLSIDTIRGMPGADLEKAIRIEEFSSTQLKPLLPYLFFGKDSSSIPPRYSSITPDSARRFRVEDLHRWDALPVYYHLLNIVGRRMLEYPHASISITGCNSDETTERSNRNLSRARAGAVRDYLKEVWGVPLARMKILTRNLPEKYSRRDDPDGMAENRRVEIDADDWRIIQPVVTAHSLSALAVRSVVLAVRTAPFHNIRRWDLALTREGKPLGRISGGNPLPTRIEWRPDQSRLSLFDGNSPVIAALTLTDSAGGTVAAVPLALPVRHVTMREKRLTNSPDRTLDKYNLILFDFDSSSFTQHHRNTMAMINERLDPGADVDVAGYTDRMGEEDRNLTLSRNRAATAAEHLAVKPRETEGRGEVPLFDNDLPEGRFYNRTVEILVMNPVRK